MWQDTEKRVAGVKRLCEKRLTSVKKGLARLTDRPIQKVEPTTKQAYREVSGSVMTSSGARESSNESDLLTSKFVQSL